MRTPAPRELLDAWEAGLSLPAVERPVPLLLAAGSVASDIDVSVGERNRLLLALRERLFGTLLRGGRDCPHCGAALEVTLSTSSLLALQPRESGPISMDGYVVHWRRVTPQDLAEAAATGSVEGARRLLLDHTVTAVEHDGETLSAQVLPGNVVAAVAAAAGEADPLADVELRVKCDECGTEQVAAVDIGGHVWSEIDAWARRILADVHTLAQAYGWNEDEVLSLSPQRRRRYLELVSNG